MTIKGTKQLEWRNEALQISLRVWTGLGVKVSVHDELKGLTFEIDTFTNNLYYRVGDKFWLRNLLSPDTLPNGRLYDYGLWSIAYTEDETRLHLEHKGRPIGDIWKRGEEIEVTNPEAVALHLIGRVAEFYRKDINGVDPYAAALSLLEVDEHEHEAN